MKKTLLLPLLLATMALGNGCSSKKDSNEAAKDANDTKVDNEATATMSDSKTDTKDVTDYMVDLANTGRAEYEMSKVAQERATNAKVKAYAAETVKMHSKDEAELKSEARKRNVTLPTTLSNDSQEMMTKLKAEKKGADFDKEYLDDMADVNDKAISKGKGLIDNTKDTELKTYVQKIISDDQEHMAKAKKLKDMIR